MAENYIEAENDYMLGMKYKDIATKYGVSINTVKSWKQRYGWSKVKKKCAYKREESMHTKKECKSRKMDNGSRDENIEESEMKVPHNLSEKQQLFCLYYVKYRNKVKAYQKAYQCSYENACSHASELCKNEEIKKEINRIIEELHQDIRIDIMDLIQQQIDIARADINDFVDISKGYVEVSNVIDGTLVKEIKNTKFGVSIKLYDKQKAIEFLKNNLPDGSDEEKASNVNTLADIILNSKPNRNLADYE